MRMLAPESFDGVFTRARAIDRGLTRGQIAWALRTGRWRRLRRGAYVESQVFDAADERGRHLMRSAAAVLVHDSRHVLSHLSAALSWELPSPFDGIGRPTLTLPGAPASTDRQADLVVQVAELRPEDVCSWSYGRRTSVARTVADCLRHLRAEDSVPIADAALRARLTYPAMVETTLRWQALWPYAERGRRSLGLVDGRRESPLESWSFVRLNQMGIELPTPQVVVHDERGRLVGRVDGWWPRYGTVCEVDGREKYLAEVADHPGELQVERTRRALVEEKVREDRLRALGLQVVRWGYLDVVRRMPQLVRDIQAAWGRGQPERVRGTFTPLR